MADSGSKRAESRNSAAMFTRNRSLKLKPLVFDKKPKRSPATTIRRGRANESFLELANRQGCSSSAMDRHLTDMILKSTEYDLEKSIYFNYEAAAATQPPNSDVIMIEANESNSSSEKKSSSCLSKYSSYRESFEQLTPSLSDAATSSSLSYDNNNNNHHDEFKSVCKKY
jgi:hypothetical protein